MTAHFDADLIFVGNVPTVVLEWDVRPDGDRPAITVPLKPEYLHKMQVGDAGYMYELAIVDPRGQN
jgi:hypothetical protein